MKKLQSAVSIGVLLISLFGGVFAVSDVALATDGPDLPACPIAAQANRTIVNFTLNGESLGSVDYGMHETPATAVNLASGKYKVTLVAYEQHDNADHVQPHESFFVKLKNGSTVIAESNSTSDIPDTIGTFLVTEVVNSSLTVSSSVNAVTAYHSAYLDNSSYNSVYPICAAFDKIDETPNLVVSCSANPTSAEIGDTVTFGSSVSGGTGAYTYSWTGTDNLSGSSQNVSKSYSSSGTKSGTVTVTSGDQTKTATCSTVIRVPEVPNLTGSCTVHKSQVDINENVQFSASASGGTGSFTYKWTGSGISMFDSFTSQTLTRSFSSEGTKTLNVEIKSGNQSIIRSCTVVVDEEEEDDDLGGSCTGTPSRADVDETITWRATATGGNGSYDYDWSGTDGLDGDDRTIEHEYDDEGTKNATVRITSNGQSITRTCHVVIEEEEEDDDDLEVSCRANPRSAEINERVTFTATVNGGNSPYEYEWDGDDRLEGDDRVITHRYSREGEYEAEVTVEDEDGNRDTARCEVEVEDDEDEVTVITDTNTPVSQVYLWQVPYTGVEGVAKIALYLLAFFAWSALITYVILKRKYKTHAAMRAAIDHTLKNRIQKLRMIAK